MKKKICILLAAILTLSVLAALPTFALVVPLPDDGTNMELEAQGYKGVTTEEELKEAQGKVYLKNDIYLTYGMSGVKTDMMIHGNGHTVYFSGGLSIMEWGKNVSVENLTLAGDVSVYYDLFDENEMINYGPLALHGIDGTLSLKDVHSHVNITIENQDIDGSIGGIISRTLSSDVYWEDISYTGTINVGKSEMVGECPTGNSIGGIAGTTSGNLTATNIYVNGEIIIDNKNFCGIGGVIGTARGGNITFNNCSFDGSLEVFREANENCGIGGIIGYLDANCKVGDNTKFVGLSNSAEITVSTPETLVPVGGIIGYAKSNFAPIALKKIVNIGKVTGTNIAGGIIGEFFVPEDGENAEILFDRNRNLVNVVANLTAGGIVGKVTTNAPITFVETITTGNISVRDEENGKAAGTIADFSSTLEKSVSASNLYNIVNLYGANVSPIFDIDSAYLADEIGDCFYSSELEGEHFGTKKTKSEIQDIIYEIDIGRTSEFREAVSSLYRLRETDYTAESWANAQNAIYAGNASLSGEDEPTQEQIDAATAVVYEAIAKLELKPIDRTELDKYLELSKEYDMSEYRGDSLREFQRALEAAQGEFTKQSEVDVAANDLKDILDRLRCKCQAGLLPELLVECRKITNIGYSDTLWSNFTEALEFAENATLHDAKFDAYFRLLEAKEKLTKLELSKLEEVIAKIPENRDLYNDNGLWEAIDQIAQMAKEIINGADVSQERVDDIVAKLQNLLDELQLEDVIDSNDITDASNAWDDYVSQHGAASPFADNDNFDCQSTVTAPTVILTIVFALGAGVTFKKKKD